MNSKKCKFGNSLMKQSEPRKPSILEFWIRAFFCCTIIESMKFLRSHVNLTLSTYSSTHMSVFLTQRLGLRGLLRPVFLKKVIMFFSIIDIRTSSVISMVKAKRKLKKCTMKKPNRWSKLLKAFDN